MILQVMRATKNFFAVSKVVAEFEIINKQLDLNDFDFLTGQYVAVTNSILNNGVYIVDDEKKITVKSAEIFNGAIYGLAPPPDFLDLVAEIARFETTEVAQNVGITSERFENYAWTAATGSDGMPITWQTAYKDKLRKFNKMYPGIKI